MTRIHSLTHKHSHTQEEFWDLEVTKTGEDEYLNHVERRFRVKHTLSGETRDVVHLQYTCWPDHGVPDTATEMLDFRETVRNLMGLQGGR